MIPAFQTCCLLTVDESVLPPPPGLALMYLKYYIIHLAGILYPPYCKANIISLGFALLTINVRIHKMVTTAELYDIGVTVHQFLYYVLCKKIIPTPTFV